jgi:two-component system phosphate regulon sensor histidine kinase PhoR
LSGERILVVDDSTEVQDVLRNLVLEPAGYRVLTVGDGAEGLRLALEEKPALLILDEQMPGMTGAQILEALREQGVDIPVILMTCHGSEELAVQAFRQGVRDYVIKPFEPAEMGRAVERVLEEVRLRRERDRLVQELEETNQRLQQQVQEANTIYSIGRSVASFLDLDTVLTRVVEAAVFLARAEEGLLLLTEEETGDLLLRAAKNVDEKKARGLRIRVQDSLAGQVIESGEPLLMVSGQPKVATGYLVRALIYAPLRTPERGVIGILGVANREKDHPFSAGNVRVLLNLADYAAVAVENARLFEESEAERRRLRSVLRETEEGVIILDGNLRVLLCNPAAGAALELPPGVIGRPALEVISYPPLQELVHATAKVGRTLHAEVAVRSGRIYSVQMTPVEQVGYALMMQDITHLKELDRVKSQFVSTVSQDLRTPLTTIQGYVDLLDRVGPLNDEQRSFLERVRASIVQITDLIGNLLDLGRIEAGYDLEMEPLHVEGVIEAVVEDSRASAEEKHIELRWRRHALPLVRGNPRLLRQAVENLLGNAVKYTQGGGWVAVEAGEDEGHIVVRVADSGVGIPLADQPFIFERFYRVYGEEAEKLAGTGLGLAIVKSVIERHGGRIWVESRPGEGSVFTFLLHTME